MSISFIKNLTNSYEILCNEQFPVWEILLGHHAYKLSNIRINMQKVKDFLTSINFSVLVLLMVCTRVTIFGASIGDALTVLAICSLVAISKWIESKKVNPVNEQLIKDIVDMKSTVTNLLLKQSVKPPTTPLNPDLKRFF